MRLFQRILALRLDLGGMRERLPAQCRLAYGVAIVALVGETIGGPLLGQGDYLCCACLTAGQKPLLAGVPGIGVP
jgi:hypothetical protein